MRKLAVLVVALALLSACSSGGSGSGSLDSLAAGSGSYYLQAAAASKDAAAEASGALYRIEAGEAGAVTWYDDSGNAVAVTVNHARTLSGGRLLLGVTYSGEATGYIADTASGALVELAPMPSGWIYARESGDRLYYIADGGLYSASLETGAGELESPAGESLASDAWLLVPSYGGVLYIAQGDTYEGFAAQRYYPGDGAAAVKTNRQLPDPTTACAIEGLDGTVYALAMIGDTVTATPYTESGGSGAYLAGTPATLETLTWTSSTGALSLSPESDTHTRVLGNEGGAVIVTATASGLASSAAANPGGWAGLTYIGSGNAETVAAGGELYHAHHEIGATGPGYDVTRYHIWRVPLGTPTAKAIAPDVSEEVRVDYNVSGLAAVGGRLFYARDAAGGGRETVLVDPETGAAEVYASGEVAIAAIE